MTEIVNKNVLNELGIVFKNVKFKNFMSFGNVYTEIDLNNPGTTLLMGENLDKGGSSGAGKSTLINAISYCLYDKIPSNISKDKLINRTNDKKNTFMEVHLTFLKGKDVYQVRRWRGGSTGVELLCNDIDMTPASVNRGEDSFNSKIEEILGFSYTLFSQIILFNGNSLPFLDLSVSAQRSLIEELFKITMLSKKAIALKKLISESDKSISMQKLMIQQQQKQNEIHKKHIQEAYDRISRWTQTNEADISIVSESIKVLSNIDFDSEESLHGEITSLKEQINELNNKQESEASIFDSKLRELETRKRAKFQEKGTEDHVLSNRDLNELRRKLSIIDKELVHLSDSKCPYCLQQYAEAQTKIADLNRQRSDLEEQIKAKNEEVEMLLAASKEETRKRLIDVAAIEQEIEAFKSTKKQSVYKAMIDEKQTMFAEITSVLTYKDLNSLLKAKNELISLTKRLELLKVETNPHAEAYDSLLKEGEIKVDVESLDALILMQDHQQFLLKLLTDKNSFIRKNIISKTIPFLNKRIAYYTESINLPHIVMFQSDMSCEITQIGRNLDHGNLSNGEKKMLNLSLCLAFRDVLTYLHSKVNVLFTDEVDGGSISGPDVDSLISMLKSKAWDDDISIFIISHRPEFDGRCDNNIVIRKEGGFSTLITQPD